jgi:hypothetical protein
VALKNPSIDAWYWDRSRARLFLPQQDRGYQAAAFVERHTGFAARRHRQRGAALRGSSLMFMPLGVVTMSRPVQACGSPLPARRNYSTE